MRCVGLIAGGDEAFVKAVEGAEDDPNWAASDLIASGSPQDVVVGLAASGRTPYVIGGLDHARNVGRRHGRGVVQRRAPRSARHADVAIEVATGPEVLTGSTRLKAGTAQKLVCNMLSTASMVRTGKVYGNLMVDVKPTNEKLVDRAQRIVSAAAGVDQSVAADAIAAADGNTKTAVVMLLSNCDHATAVCRLAESGGDVRAPSRADAPGLVKAD